MDVSSPPMSVVCPAAKVMGVLSVSFRRTFRAVCWNTKNKNIPAKTEQKPAAMDTKDKQMLWMATTRGILLSGDMIPLQSVAMFLVGKCCRKQFAFEPFERSVTLSVVRL